MLRSKEIELFENQNESAAYRDIIWSKVCLAGNFKWWNINTRLKVFGHFWLKLVAPCILCPWYYSLLSVDNYSHTRIIRPKYLKFLLQIRQWRGITCKWLIKEMWIIRVCTTQNKRKVLHCTSFLKGTTLFHITEFNIKDPTHKWSFTLVNLTKAIL